jgi:hypothetical protein
VKVLLPLVDKASADARATEAVLRELSARPALQLPPQRKYRYPTAQYVEELSRLLPDTTWLQQLDIRTTGKTKEVVIMGETASSSKLIELLESSKMLQNASPRGPTTRGSTPGSERFTIGAELRPRAPPEAQPLAAAPKVLAPPMPPVPASAPQGANAAAPPPTATVTPAPAKPNNGFGPFPKQ